MDNILSNILISTINQISLFVFNIAGNLLNSIDNVVRNNDLDTIYAGLMYVSIVFIACALMYKSFKFMYQGNYRLRTEYLENKGLIRNIVILFLICSFYKNIMHFTFGFWGSLFNETEIIATLKEATSNVSSATLINSMTNVMSAVSALSISLGQTVEFLSLQMGLFLSPLILIASFFNKELASRFIKYIMQGILAPISQTLIMYLVIQGILPIFLQSDMSQLVKSTLTIIIVVQSYKMAKIIERFITPDEKLEEIRKGSIAQINITNRV